MKDQEIKSLMRWSFGRAAKAGLKITSWGGSLEYIPEQKLIVAVDGITPLEALVLFKQTEELAIAISAELNHGSSGRAQIAFYGAALVGKSIKWIDGFCFGAERHRIGMKREDLSGDAEAEAGFLVGEWAENYIREQALAKPNATN